MHELLGPPVRTKRVDNPGWVLAQRKKAEEVKSSDTFPTTPSTQELVPMLPAGPPVPTQSVMHPKLVLALRRAAKQRKVEKSAKSLLRRVDQAKMQGSGNDSC